MGRNSNLLAVITGFLDAYQGTFDESPIEIIVSKRVKSLLMHDISLSSPYPQLPLDIRKELTYEGIRISYEGEE